MVAILTKAFQYNYCTTNLQRQGDARWRVHRTQGVSIMLEFILPVVVGAALLGGIFTEVVEPTANYVIDQGKAGYEYVQEKLD